MAMQAKAPIAHWTLFNPLLWVTVVLLACAPLRAQTSTPKESPSKNPAKAVIPEPAAPAPAAPAPTPPLPPPPDPLNRGTPYTSVRAFLRAAEVGDYVQAAKYLETKSTEENAEELAMQLKALLDLKTSTDLNDLSRLPEGDLKDNLPADEERVGTVTTSSGPLEIFLVRVDRPNEQPIWLFSPETLRNVPDAYDSVELIPHRDFSHYFPAWTRRVTFLSLPLWRVALSILALCVVLVFARILALIFVWLLHRSLRSRLTQAMEVLVMRLRPPIFWLMAAIVERIVAVYSLTALSRSRWEGASFLTALLAGSWLVIRLTDIVAAIARYRFTMRLQVERATFIALVSRIFKIFICIIVIIALLNRAGVNVSALVTGLGVGGVALAFAAQKTLSDLFGGISIVMRGAVRVGDFCTIAGKQGTVEEIGISALRMRTLDRTVVTIPNSKVAEMELENFNMRDQFWLHQVFTLRFDTSHSVIQRVLSGMVDILKSHPDIDPASARARLLNITNAGPQIEIFAYYRKPGADYAAFLGEQEPVLLEMMRLVEEQGTAMVAPVGVVQLDPAKLSPSATREAAD
jgi:MscS family membrane protein